jgi:hypothetical protein
VGALSPYVYWWRQGTLIQLSSRSADGALRITVDGDLTEVLNRLAKLPPTTA